MARVEWPGIPERYWPDTERPWRVKWGFGLCRDFVTREEAQAFRDGKYATLLAEGKGFEVLVVGPTNVILAEAR